MAVFVYLSSAVAVKSLLNIFNFYFSCCHFISLVSVGLSFDLGFLDWDLMLMFVSQVEVVEGVAGEEDHHDDQEEQGEENAEAEGQHDEHDEDGETHFYRILK